MLIGSWVSGDKDTLEFGSQPRRNQRTLSGVAHPVFGKKVPKKDPKLSTRKQQRFQRLRLEEAASEHVPVVAVVVLSHFCFLVFFCRITIFLFGFNMLQPPCFCDLTVQSFVREDFSFA